MSCPLGITVLVQSGSKNRNIPYFPTGTVVENRKEHRCKYLATRSSVRSLAHFAHSLTRGDVIDKMAILSGFFSIFDHSDRPNPDFPFPVFRHCIMIKLDVGMWGCWDVEMWEAVKALVLAFLWTEEGRFSRKHGGKRQIPTRRPTHRPTHRPKCQCWFSKIRKIQK